MDSYGGEEKRLSADSGTGRSYGDVKPPSPHASRSRESGGGGDSNDGPCLEADLDFSLFLDFFVAADRERRLLFSLCFFFLSSCSLRFSFSFRFLLFSFFSPLLRLRLLSSSLSLFFGLRPPLLEVRWR